MNNLTKLLTIGAVSASAALPLSAVSANEYYTYDASGNMIEKRIGTEVTRMQYNATNQLEGKVSSNKEVSFSYDRSGAMVAEKGSESGVRYERSRLSRIQNVVRGEKETHVFYDHRGWAVGKQTDAGITQWTWEGSRISVLGSKVQNSALELRDYLGSDLMASQDATAFGENQDGSFTGKFYDSDLGVFVFPYRFYRADLARWTESDPTGFPDGANFYKYTGDPMTRVDPLGTAEVNYTTEGVALPLTSYTNIGGALGECVYDSSSTSPSPSTIEDQETQCYSTHFPGFTEQTYTDEIAYYLSWFTLDGDLYDLTSETQVLLHETQHHLINKASTEKLGTWYESEIQGYTSNSFVEISEAEDASVTDKLQILQKAYANAGGVQDIGHGVKSWTEGDPSVIRADPSWGTAAIKEAAGLSPGTYTKVEGNCDNE